MTGTIYPKGTKTKYKIVSIRDTFSFIKYRLKYKRYFKFWFIKFSLWLNAGLEDNRHRVSLEKFVKDYPQIQECFDLRAKNAREAREKIEAEEKTTYYN